MPVIGIDDTDSSREMCTTYLTVEILRRTSLDLIGFPNLVRLNPNIPLKTRGNAAISLTLGRGEGERRIVGTIDGEAVYSFPRYREEKMDIDILSIIERFSPKDERTNPALIISHERGNPEFYWEAVREFIDFRNVLGKVKGDVRTINGDVGIVGANAAISWPGERVTYELISYLDQSRWGGEHSVDDESAKYLEMNFQDTFDNYDFQNGYNAIRPTTKTPVLFGIRGIDPVLLAKHRSVVRSEPYSSYLIYVTNQGTDDHLVERTIDETKLYNSSILTGFLKDNPSWLRGGVLQFTLEDGHGEIKAVAMEPTKQFRLLLSKLRKGDRVRVYGGVTKPGFINLEKINVLSLSTVKHIIPPVCRKCGTRMESYGRNSGFRCRKCGARTMKGEEFTERRDIQPGFYEVPVIARRHLSRPLKLGAVK